MKNRLLKTITAIAFGITSMAILNVTNVFAVDQTEVFYVYNSDIPSDVSNSTIFSGAKSGSNQSGGAFDGQLGANTYKTTRRGSNTTGPITFTIDSAYKGDFYIAAKSSGDDPRTLTLKNTETNDSKTGTTGTSNVEKVEFTNLEAGTYSLTGNNNFQYSILVLDLTLVSTDPIITASEETLNIMSGNTAEFTATLKNPGDVTTITTQTSGNITATFEKDTSVTDEVKGTVTVNVPAGTPSGKETVTLSANGAKPVTVDVIIGNVISLVPETSDGKIKYTFTGHTGDVLTTDSNAAEKTAYSTQNENVSVEFVDEGAKLVDNSSSQAATLNVPVGVSNGKLTVDGSVIVANNIGGNWAIVNFGNTLFIGSSNDKYLVLTGDLTKNAADETNAGLLTNVTSNKTLNYHVDIDFTTGLANGWIQYDGGNQVQFTNVALGTGKATYSVSSISFTTNGGGTGNSARTLIIPELSYSVTEPENTAETKAQIGHSADYYCVDNSALYIIHVVTDAEMDADTLYLENGENKVAETNEVYTSVKFADGSELTSSDNFGGKNIYVIKVNGATSSDVKSSTAFTWGTTAAAV